jgi:hypothetical protein
MHVKHGCTPGTSVLLRYSTHFQPAPQRAPVAQSPWTAVYTPHLGAEIPVIHPDYFSFCTQKYATTPPPQLPAPVRTPPRRDLVTTFLRQCCARVGRCVGR